MKQLKPYLAFLLVLSFVWGCAWKLPFMRKVSVEPAKIARRIAVMPVINKTADQKAAPLLREKIIEELYYKGYQRIASKVIDDKLSSLNINETGSKGGSVLPKSMVEPLGADAVLYCTLNEFKTLYKFFYAPSTVSITLELRSQKTGEILWKARSETIKRRYGITKKQLEWESIQIYELILQEALDKAMETLPDAIGS
jgi:hypothetical protein